MNEHQEITEALELGFERILGQIGPSDKKLWGYAEIAEYTGIPADTIQRSVCKHPKFPKKIKLGKYIKYNPADVKKYFDSLRS